MQRLKAFYFVKLDQLEKHTKNIKESRNNCQLSVKGEGYSRFSGLLVNIVLKLHEEWHLLLRRMSLEMQMTINFITSCESEPFSNR